MDQSASAARSLDASRRPYLPALRRRRRPAVLLCRRCGSDQRLVPRRAARATRTGGRMAGQIVSVPTSLRADTNLARLSGGSACAETRSLARWPARPAVLRRDYGDAQGSSGDMQESCFGLAPRYARCGGSRALSGCRMYARSAGCRPVEADPARCLSRNSSLAAGRGGCMLATRLGSRLRCLTGGCTEGPCLTRSSRSQPAQRAASGGGP